MGLLRRPAESLVATTRQWCVMPELTFVLPHWLYWGGLILFPLFYMAVLKITGADKASSGVKDTDELVAEVMEVQAHPYERYKVGNAVTVFLDRVSVFGGSFVAYWTVIAVVVYFYEVVARYFFNSPTNWAHESMFLMFGMLYLMAGAYAYFHDAHVRVDLFYSKFSDRGRAAIDIFTSMFFIMFSLAFIWTTWRFFAQSMNQETWFWAQGWFDEVSFTEWAIAYYPVKFVLFLGALTLAMQGVSRLIKDIQVFNRAYDAEHQGRQDTMAAEVGSRSDKGVPSNG